MIAKYKRYLPHLLFLGITLSLTILGCLVVFNNVSLAPKIEQEKAEQTSRVPRNNQLIWDQNDNIVEWVKLNAVPVIITQEMEDGAITIKNDSTFDNLINTELKGNPNFSNYNDKKLKRLNKEKGYKEYLESLYKKYNVERNILDTSTVQHNLAYFITAVAKQASVNGDTFFISARAFHYNYLQIQPVVGRETIPTQSKLHLTPLFIAIIILNWGLIYVLFSLATKKVSKEIINDIKQKEYSSIRIDSFFNKTKYAKDLEEDLSQFINEISKDVREINKPLSFIVERFMMEGKRSILFKNSLFDDKLSIKDILTILKDTHPDSEVVRSQVQLLEEIKGTIELDELEVHEDKKRRIKLADLFSELWNDGNIKISCETILLSEFRFQYIADNGNKNDKKLRVIEGLIADYEAKLHIGDCEYSTLFKLFEQRDSDVTKEKEYLSKLYDKYSPIRTMALHDYYKVGKDDTKRSEIKTKFLNAVVEFSFHSLDHLSEKLSNLKLTSPETISMNKKLIHSESSVREVLSKTEYVIYQANGMQFAQEMDFVKLLNELGVTSLEGVIIKGTYYPKEVFQEKNQI